MPDTVRLALAGEARLQTVCLNGLKTLWDHGRRDFELRALVTPAAIGAWPAGLGPRPLDEAFGPPEVRPEHLGDGPPPAVYPDLAALLADAAAPVDAVLGLPASAAVSAAARGWLALVDLEALAAADASLGGLTPLVFHCHRPLVRMACGALGQGLLGELRVVRVGGPPDLAAVLLAECLAGAWTRLGPHGGRAGAVAVELLAEPGPFEIVGQRGTLAAGWLTVAGQEGPLAGWFGAHLSEAERERRLPHKISETAALALDDWLVTVAAGGDPRPWRRAVALARALERARAGGSELDLCHCD
jgi:hypothetical protein